MHDTRDLPHEAWSEYFDALSRELFNAPVSIEVERPAEKPAIEAEHLALQLLTYDRRGDVFEVAVAQGGPHLPGLVRHLIDHPRRIAVDSETMLAPMMIAVDGDDGARTVIRIDRDAEITS